MKNEPKAYGGELLKTRKGRAHGRPLDTKNTLHMVLRSTKATGDWSFKKPKNEAKIRRIVDKFSLKYGIKILRLGNAGNHLHFQIKIGNRHTYRPFIRAITSAIAMAISGTSRWNPLKKKPSDRFWDYRPFTRVIIGFKAFLDLQNYIDINQLEGFGNSRIEAKWIIADSRDNPEKYAADPPDTIVNVI